MKQPLISISFLITHLLSFFFLIICPGFVSAQTADPETLPLAAGIRVNKAQVLFQTGEVAKAAALLEEFKMKNTGAGRDHYYIHFLLGNYYLSLAQDENNKALYKKAVNSYQDAVQKNPKFAAGWLNLAKSLYESDAFASAGEAFEKGYYTSETQKPVHLYYAAVCYFHADDRQKSLTVFNRLIAAHPDKITLAWKETFVNILFSLERFEQALPHLKELAETSAAEKKKKWQEILLHQYLSLNMDKKALAYAGFLTRTDPLESKWWKAICHIHLNGNRFRQGLSALIIYGYLTPMTKEEQMLAADLYLTLDIPVKAASFYQDAIKEALTPEHILKRSRACSMAHDPDKALFWIEQGLSAFQNINLLQMKARILYSKKAYEKAADAYEKLVQQMLLQKSISKKHSLGEAWLMLGYSAMNDQQLTRAETAFAKASGYKKQKKSALKAIAVIKAMGTN